MAESTGTQTLEDGAGVETAEDAGEHVSEYTTETAADAGERPAGRKPVVTGSALGHRAPQGSNRPGADRARHRAVADQRPHRSRSSSRTRCTSS